MSVMEIPDELYTSIYENEVALQISKGLDLKAAKQMASEMMSHCFVSRAIVECAEFEKDRTEYIEEMSLGGQTYREPR